MTLNSFLTLAGSIGLVIWVIGAAAMLSLIVRVSKHDGTSPFHVLNLLQTISVSLLWPLVAIVAYCTVEVSE